MVMRFMVLAGADIARGGGDLQQNSEGRRVGMGLEEREGKLREVLLVISTQTAGEIPIGVRVPNNHALCAGWSLWLAW